MFTGIIECQGTIKLIENQGTNTIFILDSPITGELKIDESVSHNGVCLTIEKISGQQYQVTAIKETLEKTNLGQCSVGDQLNLERAMQMNGRLDGHLVQGHVDTTATCFNISDEKGSYNYTFTFDSEFTRNVIEKGSVCVNGISLTAFNVGKDRFTVAIIPYTYEHTNLRHLKVNEQVNIEFDMVGKYVLRNMQSYS